MANLGKIFDPNQQEPAIIGGSQLPISDKMGWPMVITDSEMKETSAKDGQGFLEITVQIIDGEHKGVEGKERFNLFNNNPQTVAISERELTALAYCTGIFQPFSDSAILHNRPFRGVVGLQKDKEKAEKGYTEIKGYLDINGNAAKKGVQTATPTPAPTPAPTSAPANTGWSAPANTAPTPWDQSAGNAPVSTDPPWMKKP